MFWDLRTARRAFVGTLVASLHAIALAALIVPLGLLGALAPCGGRAAIALETSPGVADADAFSDQFAADAARFGLVPVSRVETTRVNQRVTSLSGIAAVPIAERTTPTFFWRRTHYVLAEAPGRALTVAREDMTVAYAPPRVTVRFVSVFTESGAQAEAAGIAGTEVRRILEFDVDDIESIGTAVRAQGGGGELTSLPPGVDPNSYRERLTIVSSDGRERTYAAGEVDLAAALGLGGGAGAGCMQNCFSKNGGTIGFLSAVCLVGGVVVCGAVCAGTVGVGCFPCIAGAGTLCGVTIAAGSLGACIVECAWPGSVTATPTRRPPTPTRRVPTPRPPTPTPLPCVGDCNGDRVVTLGELQTALDAFFDEGRLAQCRQADRNRDGGVSLGEVQTAQGNFFDDCP